MLIYSQDVSCMDWINATDTLTARTTKEEFRSASAKRRFFKIPTAIGKSGIEPWNFEQFSWRSNHRAK